MGHVRGCLFPDDLFYDVEANVWVRPEDDHSITVGMTSYACALSGPLISYTPKKAGKSVKREKSCVTVESGKWVGPVKAPVNGSVLEVNAVLFDTPGLINDDPYGEGWLIRLQPDDWQGELALLKTGAAAAAAFEDKMAEDGFEGC
ncbi:MAG: glycine cleavage system protein H [Gammaproteobacteria bacterium SG8_47]|nr:MAG: glycine cleavage system protein H [Gammaproteobacteria bacterium SG8_47]